MTPAVAASIPIFIRNTFNPSFPGTRIYVSSESTIDREMCVCGFSTIDNMALLNLEGGVMGGSSSSNSSNSRSSNSSNSNLESHV